MAIRVLHDSGLPIQLAQEAGWGQYQQRLQDNATRQAQLQLQAQAQAQQAQQQAAQQQYQWAAGQQAAYEAEMRRRSAVAQDDKQMAWRTNMAAWEQNQQAQQQKNLWNHQGQVDKTNFDQSKELATFNHGLRLDAMDAANPPPTAQVESVLNHMDAMELNPEDEQEWRKQRGTLTKLQEWITGNKPRPAAQAALLNDWLAGFKGSGLEKRARPKRNFAEILQERRWTDPQSGVTFYQDNDGSIKHIVPPKADTVLKTLPPQQRIAMDYEFQQKQIELARKMLKDEAGKHPETGEELEPDYSPEKVAGKIDENLKLIEKLQKKYAPPPMNGAEASSGQDEGMFFQQPGQQVQQQPSQRQPPNGQPPPGIKPVQVFDGTFMAFDGENPTPRPATDAEIADVLKYYGINEPVETAKQRAKLFANGVPQLSSDKQKAAQEWDLIPSGAEFIDPNGKRRRKP